MREIIIIDSGVGGFSILKEILSRKLGYDLTYLADQANLPYTGKSPEWLARRMEELALWAKPLNPAALALACNTATVTAVEPIRRILNCPVIGLEPVVKPLSGYQSPLVLATGVTISSKRTLDLIAKYNPATVTHFPSGLVQAVENMDRQAATNIIGSLDSLIKTNQVDAVGLSCTHYPLVSDIIAKLYPDLVLIDPSAAVVNHLLTNLHPALPAGRSGVVNTPSLNFLTTGDPQILTKQVQYYLKITTAAQGVSI